MGDEQDLWHVIALRASSAPDPAPDRWLSNVFPSTNEKSSLSSSLVLILIVSHKQDKVANTNRAVTQIVTNHFERFPSKQRILMWKLMVENIDWSDWKAELPTQLNHSTDGLLVFCIHDNEASSDAGRDKMCD